MSLSQVDTARQIKERLCYVGHGSGQKGHTISVKPQDTGPADFELPDGTIIRSVRCFTTRG
jgi:hypothetical protein